MTASSVHILRKFMNRIDIFLKRTSVFFHTKSLKTITWVASRLSGSGVPYRSVFSVFMIEFKSELFHFKAMLFMKLLRTDNDTQDCVFTRLEFFYFYTN